MKFFKHILPLFVLLLIQCGSEKNGVSIIDGNWHLNGSILNPGTPAEGLLINIRMVNATFEDAADSTFNVNENTDEFINAIPAYKAFGVNAFTLNLQGGMPGYEGAINSAFKKDGTLLPDYTNRIERVIRECENHDMIVILGLFYQRQDQILQDSLAVKNAVVNSMNWITQNNFSNLIVEIANEFPHGGFDHGLIQSAQGMESLIQLAKTINQNVLVSASGLGNGKLPQDVIDASDYLLIHFNGTPVEEIPLRIKALKKFNKPIVCNEDDKVGEEACAALLASIENSCSYGYMNKIVNQYKPFDFAGQPDDPEFYQYLSTMLNK